MVSYKSSHTGNQIDTVVTTVTNNDAKVKYGNIIGTLSNQVDLQNVLNAKQNTLTAGTDINITNNTISFSNDTGYITNTVSDLTNYTKTSDLGDLALLDTVNYETQVTNKPTIPTKISDLTDNTATYPIDKADTLTGLTATVSELNYCDGVTSSVQTQIDTLWLDNDRLYEGVDLSVKFATEIAQYSTIYDWLNARKTAGNFSGIHVGDYINVPTSAGTCAGYSITAQTHKCRVIGINTYKRCADTDIGNMIYFSSDNVVDTPIKWNPADNNNGTSVNNEPYLASAAYAVLNGVNNYTTSAYNNVAHGADASSGGILQLLPSALQNVLKTKRNVLDTRYSSSGLLTYSTGWGWKDMGKLWMPNEIEVYGTQIKSNLGYAQGYWNPEANLSIQFPWFANNCNHRIKYNSGGSRDNWWLSSAGSFNSARVCIVGYNGFASDSLASSSYVCVPLCFCI